MNIHTPRRRVSSRTKQRCRNIKKFFCKALGTSSQIENKTHSSVQLSVSDLKQKIDYIETQLEKVSKHCYELGYIDNKFELSPNKRTQQSRSGDKVSATQTEVLYKATNSRYKNTDENDNLLKNNEIESNMTSENENPFGVQSQFRYKHHSKKINNDASRLRKVESYVCQKSAPQYLRSDVQNINKSEYVTHKRNNSKKKHPDGINIKEYRNLFENEGLTQDKKQKYHRRETRHKHPELDQEFILDIIKKQYKPVKLFGRIESDFSQISAPVCRDREFSIRQFCPDNDLCSCCFDQRKKHEYKSIKPDVSDTRSVCDTRLYSSKRQNRKRQPLNDYNNSEYYDLVPVKEKSSPKQRRKFAENVTVPYQNYKEVLPSPRTQRPRLNLKAKTYDDYDEIFHLKKDSDPRINPKNRMFIASDDSSNIYTKSNINMTKQTKKIRQFENVEHTIKKQESSLNTHIKDFAVDKTDKTLGEIKDLLENFLTVIKKDSIHKENSCKENENSANFSRHFQDTTKGNNNYNMGQCNVSQIVPVFPNPCCYPIMPVCPVNYLQNGCVFSNASTTCPQTTKEPKRNASICNTKQDNGNTSKETKELIKEIHKLVTQSPKPLSKKLSETYIDRRPNKLTTTRSVGNSSVVEKNNCNYKVTAARCLSQNCDPLASRIYSSTQQTNASFSDTVLDKMSVEATHSSTECEVETKEPDRKANTSKLKDIFKPWKWRKKNKDDIQELSESESTIEVDIQRKFPPFRQNITNYAMHSQEFYDSPPTNRRHFNNPRSNQYRQSYPNLEYGPRFEARNDPRNEFNYSYYHLDNPPSPPYQRQPNGYANMPQVPLCLKEIEVKSVGTQSERKLSLIKKLSLKAKAQKDASQHHNASPSSLRAKPGTFNWKSFQENAKRAAISKDFPLKTQKHLEEGDMKMRNAMIKKLFYKRNPFSPRNLIVRTLLGKDPSSFGNPPKMYKPKMFL